MSAQSRPLEDSGEWIFNTIKRNPEALLLLAAGAVLMMRTNAPQSSRATSMGAASPQAASMACRVRRHARCRWQISFAVC